MNLWGAVKLTATSSFTNYFINDPTQDYSLAVNDITNDKHGSSWSAYYTTLLSSACTSLSVHYSSVITDWQKRKRRCLSGRLNSRSKNHKKQSSLARTSNSLVWYADVSTRDSSLLEVKAVKQKRALVKALMISFPNDVLIICAQRKGLILSKQ